MKIVLFGTPDFAVATLEKLVNSVYEISTVVTIPDKQMGRGQKISFSPVKDFSLKHNINLLQPENLKDEKFILQLKELNADLFVVVAYKILPVEVFSIPKMGTFNLHASLLPKYRGAAPIQWALINGEQKTGVTTFFIKEKVDTGDIILQKEVSISDKDDYGSLYEKLKIDGADLVLESIELIQEGNIDLLRQNDTQASPAPKITDDLCVIDWNKSAKAINNLIRGLSPVPGAYFIYNDKRYKIFKSEVVSYLNLKIGEVYQTKNELIVGCGYNSIKILEVQPEGRKKMKTEEFLRGYKI
ncbi:MAG: methionyl-tRNA formyltransferase [Ignavibacteriales bacterium]|nr:methionyl-tRNA formyltransferase [Ignavibacteriales bacterium]